MKIELYLDSLFLVNFIINWGILKLLQHKFSIGQARIRMILAAFLGAAAYILLFFLPMSNLVWQFAVQGLSVPLMVSIILPKRKKRYVLKMTVWGYAYSFIISGILRAVFEKWKLFSGQEITVMAIILGVYVCVSTGRWMVKYNKEPKKKNLCKVIVESAGTKNTVTALVDTGNSLREPVSHKPVCLLEEELLAKITLENPLFLRAIPFHSVGCDRGTLYGVLLPKLTIICGETEFELKDVICAGVNRKLSVQGTYQMILHPELLTEKDSSTV